MSVNYADGSYFGGNVATEIGENVFNPGGGLDTTSGYENLTRADTDPNTNPNVAGDANSPVKRGDVFVNQTT